MRSRPFRPLGFAHLCRSRPRGSIHSLLPSSLYLDHSHGPVLAPATLAALQSTRAIPDRCVFYVADPISSIASRPHCKHLPRMTSGLGPGLVIPDLWQQEAVRALQQGKDVVVQAPTGSGKTYIF